MQTEKSAGIIIFRKGGGKRYYLLLHYGSGARKKKPFWDFVKGHIEKGEDEITAARREAEEETGLTDIRILGGFQETIKYFFVFKGNRVLKTVVFFVGETKEEKINISFEHIGFKWLPFKKAIETLTIEKAKETLAKANCFLDENEV